MITYLVAEGVLRDRMAKQAGDEGVEVVPGTLSDTEALARLVVARTEPLVRPLPVTAPWGVRTDCRAVPVTLPR